MLGKLAPNKFEELGSVIDSASALHNIMIGVVVCMVFSVVRF